MEEKIWKIIKEQRLIQNGDKVVVAVSGGPDSMCLLQILNRIQKNREILFEIYVAHVNHGIRQEAEEETNYVEQYCVKHDIPIFIKKENVIQLAQDQKKGIEETGREVRYEFFDQVLKEIRGNKIAIAHNLNDKVETVLMNMIRGTGTNGLKGIEMERDHKYIRPLLSTTRKEIEEYCKKQALDPKYDQSNQDNHYTRNRIRNELIPYLEKEFNPNILNSIYKLSEIITEEQNYLEKMVHNIYNELLIEKRENEIVLDLKKFNLQDKIIKSRIILYTIFQLKGNTNNIEKIHIEDIIKLCSNNIGNKYLQPKKSFKILIKKGKVFFFNC